MFKKIKLKKSSQPEKTPSRQPEEKNPNLEWKHSEKTFRDKLHPEASEQPSSPELESSSPETQTSEAPKHFDDLITGSDIAGNEQPDGVSPNSPASSGKLRKQDFQKLFIGCFSGASLFTGLKSLKLPNGEVDERAALECSDAIYDTILDIPALHFILHPANKWLDRVSIITIFSTGMVRAVAMEKAQQQPPDEPQSSGAPAQPTPDGSPNAEQRAALTGS